MKNVTRAVEQLKAAFGEDFQKLSKEEQAQKAWAELRAAGEKVPFLAALLKVQEWLNQPVVSRGTPADRAASKCSSSRPQRTSSSKSKEIYKSPTTNPVKAARTEPRSGRSSLFSGLLAGPWG